MINILEFLPLDILLGKDEEYRLCFLNKTIFKHYKLGFGMDNFLDFNDPQNISNIAGRIVYGNVTINF